MIVPGTNVVSELMRPGPAPRVAAWIRVRDRRELRMTSITLAEIRYGIARLPDGRRKQVLPGTADDIFRAFPGQVLPSGTAAAGHYATIASSRERAGKPIPGSGALTAAACRPRAAALATRNLPGFEGTGIEVTDPRASA